MTTQVVIGIDLGTQGVRAIAVTDRGQLAASAEQKLRGEGMAPSAESHEQSPEAWWEAVTLTLRALMQAIAPSAEVAGLAVDSTSGTILALDDANAPLGPALMYNDRRSQPYVAEVQQAGEDLQERLGYRFSASFALPKLVWLQRECPEIFERAHRFVHATDFIVGRLSGEYGATDYTNALKTGYDLLNDEWPAFIEALGIPTGRLPGVVRPGTPIGTTGAELAEATGIPAGTPVVAGATDGTASHFASGAVETGSWTSSLGTTFVVKGTSERLLRDPQRRIYCHRHPDGGWMPGGASNTGTEWIGRRFPGQDPAQLSTDAIARIPTGALCYPLARQGERFPFQHDRAEGFTTGEVRDELDAFAAGLEGVAMLERLSYDLLEELGAERPAEIYVTGGGSRSPLWLQIRASTLGRPLVRTAINETAMGAALLAAAGVWYGSLTAAGREMVERIDEVGPDARLEAAYEEKYHQFVTALQVRGYYGTH